MRRFLLLIIISLACKVSVFGSHIVGGEFELLHLQNFQYRLNMILYFDEINGAQGAKDPTVNVFIWRKSDNQLMRTITLSQIEDIFVPYSNSDCDDGQLITSRILYSAEITLSESDYSDPEGYYISWERCCRNYTISNIRSDQPGTGISAGQTFYLEFPPVTINGEPFINSTPKLFPPLRDYGCVDKFYFVDFGGVDDDGDSLVYSIVTPYSTFNTDVAIPPSPSPGPYPEVVWQSGYSLDNIMDGDPDMAITTKGLLTVTPKTTGLFVFAVKCEEYRDGVKIGEMRRDFQMLVVSNCANENPTIRAREQGESSFYNEGEVLNFNFSDTDKCVEILVNDQPVSGDTQEIVTVRAIPINFDAELEGIEIDFSQNVAIESELDTARFTVCFPDCPFTRGGFYQIGIIGYDDACPQPALDTVIVSLNVPPPPNQTAYYANAKGGSRYNTLTRTVVEQANGNLSIPINAFDNDNDSISMVIEPLGFDLATVGMSFSEPTHSAGEVSTIFNWDFDCNAENLDLSSGRDVSSGGVIRKAFDILITTEDHDTCEWEDPETLLMTLIIEFPEQTKPRVYRQGQPGLDQVVITQPINSILNVPIRADDADGDQISLVGQGLDFNFNALGASFENTEGAGVPGIGSNFSMPLPCDFDLTQRDSLNMQFIVEDLDACQLTNADTLSVSVNLVAPINNAPLLSFSSLNQKTISNDTISLILGESIDAVIQGFDNDNDSISLVLAEVTNGASGFSFEPTSGIGNVSQPFIWTPSCDVFKDEGYNETFKFTFVLTDNNCYTLKNDSLSFYVNVEDVNPGEEDFIPPNFFSPGGNDELNAFFGPYRRAEADEANPGELVNLLPNDNCAGQYLGVVIYNRWGRTVFESTSRDFKWFGDDEPAGVYYYHVSFSNRDYKGWIQMMK